MQSNCFLPQRTRIFGCVAFALKAAQNEAKMTPSHPLPGSEGGILLKYGGSAGPCGFSATFAALNRL
jgi:hypothetical protein